MDDYIILQNKSNYFQKPYNDLKSEIDDLRLKYEDLRYTFNPNENLSCVWQNNTYNSGKLHSCTKPLDIIEKILKASSNEGDIVLDCFLGSGTTAVACVNTNRKCIGIERDEKYFDISCTRVDEAVNKPDAELF